MYVHCGILYLRIIMVNSVEVFCTKITIHYKEPLSLKFLNPQEYCPHSSSRDGTYARKNKYEGCSNIKRNFIIAYRIIHINVNDRKPCCLSETDTLQTLKMLYSKICIRFWECRVVFILQWKSGSYLSNLRVFAIKNKKSRQKT